MPKAGYTACRYHKTPYHACCFNSAKRILPPVMPFPDVITVSSFVIPSVPPPWPCLNGSVFNIVKGFLVLQKYAHHVRSLQLLLYKNGCSQSHIIAGGTHGPPFYRALLPWPAKWARSLPLTSIQPNSQPLSLLTVGVMGRQAEALQQRNPLHFTEETANFQSCKVLVWTMKNKNKITSGNKHTTLKAQWKRMVLSRNWCDCP